MLIDSGSSPLNTRGDELKEAKKKLKKLEDTLKEMGSVLVAFSAGVDSTFLLKAASSALGENVAALTATSPTYPESELKEAVEIAKEFGVRHIICDSNELLIPNFAENPGNRCFYCKNELFTICIEKAKELGIKRVLDGTNADDADDLRPGKEAARTLGVLSPLEEAGLTKKEIRLLSKTMGLKTWDKPNLACLSSRFPYGTRITEERLDRIKKCEDYLKGLGFKQLRVRYHDEVARIEVEPASMKLFLEDGLREAVTKRFKEIGFTYVTLDLKGYRIGSMNETIKDRRPESA